MPERQVITSLSGTVAPLLTVPSADPRSVGSHSMWPPRDWKKTTPFVIDDMTLPPLNSTTNPWNAEQIFELPKQCHLVKSMVLHVTLPAHTVVPLGSARLVDHFGWAMIEYFRTHFGANLCYETQPYDLYFNYRKKHKMEVRDCINEMIGGDLTQAQRTNDLQNGREFFIPLYQPFEDHQSRAFPLLTLSQKTRFVLKTKAFANITNQLVPGASTITPVGPYNFELIMKQVHLTGDEAELILAMSREQRGISYMIHQHVRQQSDNFANSTTNAVANIKMSGITKPIKALHFAWIPDRLVNDTGYNDIFMFAPSPTPVPPGMNAYNPILNYNITANGQIIQRQIVRNYDRLTNHYYYSEAPHGDEIFNQIYSEYPCSISASMGYLDYTNLNNPVLQVNFGIGGTGVDPFNPLVPQVLRLIINARDYNFWYFCNGNFTRTFN